MIDLFRTQIRLHAEQLFLITKDITDVSSAVRLSLKCPVIATPVT